MIRLKMCGLKSMQDIEYANRLKPDFIGFVFAKSKRQVSFEFAKALKSHLDRDIKAVGVFVDTAIKEILEQSCVIDAIQLHGKQDRHFIATLKSYTNAMIIKAIGVDSTQSILDALEFGADFLLLDNQKGGSGERFDWNLLKNALKQGFDKPYFLAGGLNASNLDEALRFKPYGIDLSKGLETNGIKDFEKMQKITEMVRREK